MDTAHARALYVARMDAPRSPDIMDRLDRSGTYYLDVHWLGTTITIELDMTVYDRDEWDVTAARVIYVGDHEVGDEDGRPPLDVVQIMTSYGDRIAQLIEERWLGVG